MSDDLIVFKNKKTGKRYKLKPGVENDMIESFRKNKDFKELIKL